MVSFTNIVSILALIGIAPAASFSIPAKPAAVRVASTTAPLYATQSSNDPTKEDQNNSQRRDFLLATASATIGAIVLPFSFISPALAEDEPSSSPLGPICVIGANGKTGSECVGACIARGIHVVATSRGGEYTGVYNTEENKSKGLESKVCDVTIPSTIESAIDGSRAVIFAASASKAGGTAAAVDNIGLVNVAKACIEKKVPQLVIVSSGAVTKPDSPVYKFLNLFGNIMEEKIKGEDSVRQMYANKSIAEGTYTIIRPGGLTEEEAKGVAALELNQGDNKSGRIARADVAALCIEATLNPNQTGKTTFECYDGETGKPLQTVGLSNILKQKNKADDAVYLSGKERRGSTFTEIFTGLEQD